MKLVKNIKVNSSFPVIIMGLLLHVCFKSYAQNDNRIAATRTFILSNWKNAIHEHSKDSGTLIGLPKPYSVPGVGGSFQEMYYWDTYFTNVGLIKDGMVEQAKNNVENIIYLVNRYGFMPNGNRTFFLVRSQPPYLSMMIKDIYDHTHDRKWLLSVLPSLEKEYSFWMEKRKGASGLNNYGEMAPDARKLSMFTAADRRLNISSKVPGIDEANKLIWGANLIAECESGWDFTPRFDSRCLDFFPVDLNSNLYMYEKNFSYFYKELGIKPMLDWDLVASQRQLLFRKYCLNKKDGLYYDYDFVNKVQSPILSAAIFHVLWSGIADKEDASKIQNQLSRLETPYGIVACEKGDRKFSYQWDYPNGWANLQYVSVKGLDQYGFTADAKRIAEKYISVVADNFSRTGNLWEKYNMLDGSLNAKNEYGLPALMGWTAGVYCYCMDYYNKAD